MDLRDFIYSLTNASAPAPLDDAWFVEWITFAPHHIKLRWGQKDHYRPRPAFVVAVLFFAGNSPRQLYAHVYNDKGMQLRDFIRSHLSLDIDTIVEATFYLDIESRIRFVQVDEAQPVSMATSPTFVTYAKQLEMRLLSISRLLPSARLFCH